MKKFEGILLCTDLDGTLLNSERKVSEENRRAIDYFKSQGGLFTFITGRMPFFSQKIYEEVQPNAPYGCINGGGIYDPREGKYLYTRELSLSAMELVRYADERLENIGVQINHFDKIYFCRGNEAMANFKKATGVPFLTRTFDEICEPIAKIIFGSTEEDLMLKIEKLLLSHPRANEFDFVRSEPTLFEILPKHTNKGALFPHFERLLGIKREKIIAVGDYYNDIGMVREAGLGIAVANAAPALKEIADLVTVSNNEHALAKIIEDLDSGAIRL